LHITFSQIADGGELEPQMFGLTTKFYKMQEATINNETPAIGNVLLAAALTSPALQWQSDRGGRMDYPARFRGRVPLKVVVAKNVTPDLMEFKKELKIKDDTICLKDNEYYVWVNSYGAVSAILPNGERLGLLPSEFDVTEWHS
jgi:hypothetical protein